ncbi:MAG: hypothetical protein V7629_07425 [Motiliproteus sp.]
MTKKQMADWPMKLTHNLENFSEGLRDQADELNTMASEIKAAATWFKL